MRPRKIDFLSARRNAKISRCLQIFLGLTLLIGLNYLAFQHFVRHDITYHKRFSLSPESLAYIKKIQSPIDVFVCIPQKSLQNEASQIYKHIASLLQEYEYVSRNNAAGKITVHFIDPYQESQKAHEIANRYGAHQENAIIVVSNEHIREISASDLYSFNKSKIDAFNGEQIFTSAFLDVTHPHKQKIYLLAGHGEMRINDVDPFRGISQATQWLQNHNLDIQQLDLSQEPDFPNDADLIMLVSPQAPLLSHEVEKLRHFLSDNNGRLMLFLDPAREHGLEDLFYEWGIQVDDMIVLDTGKDFQASDGDLIIRRFVQHPITQFLIDYQLAVLTGISRPVHPSVASPVDDCLLTLPLLVSSETSWGERFYESVDDFKFDPEHDLLGPVSIATLSERTISSNLGIKVPGGRLLVFGNSDFIVNNHFAALGNQILFQNAINWILDRNELLNILPRTIQKFQVTLSRQDFVHIAFALSSLPLTVLSLGLLVYVLRKR